MTDALWTLECEAWERGATRLAGIDEVGRGPLAGPVVACAYLIPVRPARFPLVNDSKQLSERNREELAAALRMFAGAGIGLGVVEPALIDQINILRATHLAMRRAVENLPMRPDFVLVDGRPVPGLPVPSRAIVKGDSKSAAIAAASIVAKVYRDHLMTDYDKQYPGYGFAAHKGYGTQAHLAALADLGPSPIHRRTFAPVRRLIEGALTQLEFEFHNDP
ncbi:MAG: ribonuclease HII [Lentisphaeria bacterium]|nr:ribonuclease HII [Lentisphaeria bacterium]